VKHVALPRFWQSYRELPKGVQQLADRSFELLKADPKNPSLHFKKVSATRPLWSARVGIHHRALALERSGEMVWFWIGTHADYDKLLG
jgi:hypothetical protein